MADPAVGNNSEIFDPTKEKKKKKKKVLDLDSVLLGGSSSAAPPPEEDPTASLGVGGQGDQDGAGNDEAAGGFDDILGDLESFGSKKKKKKVKKIVVVDEEVAGLEEVDEEGLEFEFSKKKKKKGKALDDLVAGGGEEGEVDSIPTVTVVEWDVESSNVNVVVEEVVARDDDDDENKVDEPEPIELGDDGSQPADLTFDVEGDDDHEDIIGANDESPTAEPAVPAPQIKSWLTSDRDYTYDELLTRVFEIMRAKNPEMVTGTKQKFVMRPPQVVKVGTKKTSFVNFMEICKMLHRHQKHLLDFLLSELGTSGSIDGNNQLIIKGRFQQKQIENVLRRYIKEYVTCHTCKSPNTLLQKDFRLFFLQCEACGSRCSVASIKHGFQAVTGKRAAMRAKAN